MKLAKVMILVTVMDRHDRWNEIRMSDDNLFF